MPSLFRFRLDFTSTGRASGPSILLFFHPIRRQQEVAEYIQFLLQRLRAPFFVDGSEVFASASIGVSLYPEHGRNYDALRQNADIAMYRVKNEGKGAAVFFDVSMEREALARMELEQSLRLAILDKKFCCAFQPKVDIRTREIKGIEALVRLRNDEGVLQAPGTFINLAVELGLIDELTHLVIGAGEPDLDRQLGVEVFLHFGRRLEEFLFETRAHADLGDVDQQVGDFGSARQLTQQCTE